MKQLLFHIGIPKTGSSAIQIFLARNSEALLRSSIDYLRIGEFAMGVSGKISSGNGAHLSRCLLPAKAPAHIQNSKPHLDAFFEAIRSSSAETGLISSELFVFADRSALKSLITQLGTLGVTARCFFYIRSQTQFLSSAYIQQVKRHGCVLDAASYVSQTYRHDSFLKYHTFWKEMQTLFGASNVFCRVYDFAVADKRGLFRTLIEALTDAPIQVDYGVEDINTSMSPREVALMLFLNRFKPRMEFSDMLVQNSIQLGNAAAGQVHQFLPSALVDEIEEYFKEENAALAREYFNRTELFPLTPRNPQPNEITLAELEATDVLAFVGGLLVRFDERLLALERALQHLKK